MILAIGGLFLWWPRKIFRVTGGGASWRRVNFDLHNVLGICSSLVLFIVTASGVFINQSSTLEGRSCRPWTHTAQAGTRYVNLNRSIHTGDLWGTPTRVLWFLAALILVCQTISGFLIWYKPKRPAA